ncbi:MAG: hypothetical protein ACO2Y1_07720 [Flavobacteriaceae bacterium]
MKVRITKGVTQDPFNLGYSVGEVVILETKTAKMLIESGRAEAIEEKSAKPVTRQSKKKVITR